MNDQSPNHSSVSQKVLDRLKTENVSMRSKFGVVVERIGLDGVAVGMFIVAVIAVSFVLFWAKSEGLLAYSQFGPVGLRAFLEAVPYQWLVIALLAVLALLMVLAHVADDYKVPAAQIALVLVGVVLLIGSITTVLGFSDQIIDWLSGRQLLANDLVEHHGQMGVVGIVTSVSRNQFTMVVGHDSVTVEMTSTTSAPAGQVILPGDRVLVVSQSASGGTITAAGVQKLRSVPVRRLRITDPAYQPQSS